MTTLQIQCRSRPRELLTEHAVSCRVRPDTPHTARHGESWNVMPAVWAWNAGGTDGGALPRNLGFPPEAQVIQVFDLILEGTRFPVRAPCAEQTLTGTEHSFSHSPFSKLDWN